MKTTGLNSFAVFLSKGKCSLHLRRDSNPVGPVTTKMVARVPPFWPLGREKERKRETRRFEQYRKATHFFGYGYTTAAAADGEIYLGDPSGPCALYRRRDAQRFRAFCCFYLCGR